MHLLSSLKGGRTLNLPYSPAVRAKGNSLVGVEPMPGPQQGLENARSCIASNQGSTQVCGAGALSYFPTAALASKTVPGT